MDFITGTNNYIDFSIFGQKVFVKPKHDIIMARVRIESDSDIIYYEVKTLEKSNDYFFIPHKNIYDFSYLKISVFDKFDKILDSVVYKDLCFYPSFNLYTNQFFVDHYGKLKTKIKITSCLNDKTICDYFGDFSQGSRFWHDPVIKINDMKHVKISVYDLYDNLLFDKVFDTSEINYIFCHIPKNAGTSITSRIKNNMGHNIVDKNKTNLLILAFVRNPYDRFLSCYYYLRSGGSKSDIDMSDSREYVGDYDISNFITDKLLKASLNQQHFRPQSYWIPNGADFIGRYENLQEDFDKMMDLINLPRQTLPVINKSKRENHILTDEQKEIIYQIYKEDFDRFGYSK